MAEVGSQLPPGTSSIIERQTPSVFPIISFVVSGGRDPSALHDYAYYDLRPRISRIPDVSYVTVQGGDIREILVEVEPAALVATGLSIADVADRLGKRASAEGRGPDRSRHAAISGVGRQPGDQIRRIWKTAWSCRKRTASRFACRDLGRVTIGTKTAR